MLLLTSSVPAGSLHPRHSPRPAFDIRRLDFVANARPANADSTWLWQCAVIPHTSSRSALSNEAPYGDTDDREENDSDYY